MTKTFDRMGFKFTPLPDKEEFNLEKLQGWRDFSGISWDIKMLKELSNLCDCEIESLKRNIILLCMILKNEKHN